MSTHNLAPTELGTESVGKLLKKYAVPGIIAMTASSLYNMVDSIFIGHISANGTIRQPTRYWPTTSASTA